MKMKSFLLFLATIVHTSTSDDSFLKSCPKVNVLKPFEVNKFLGLWHQFAISGDLFKNPCEKSVTLEWALSGKNVTITTYRICSKGMICRRKQTIWKAELGDPDEKTGQIDGKLNLTVNRPDFGKATVDLLVLNTDYVHSAVLYTCSVIGNRTMAIWILTRKQKPSDTEMADILTTVDAVLETNQLDQFEFRLTNPKCESVVKTNSKEGKLDNEDTTTDPPMSSTNTPPTLQTNSDGYPGVSSNSSNITNINENNKSKLNTPLALSEENDNKTHTSGQKTNNPSPTTESLLKQNPTNNSFTDTGLSKTLNSSVDRMSSNNGKEKTDKNVLYSVLQNLLTQKPKCNSTDNSIDKLPNEDDKLSRRNRKRKLSIHKPRKFESEQNKLHSLPENPLAENPFQDNNNGLSGGHSLSESIAQNLPTGQEEPAEGFFPSLARQEFFKYIPKAFNFDFWRI